MSVKVDVTDGKRFTFLTVKKPCLAHISAYGTLLLVAFIGRTTVFLKAWAILCDWLCFFCVCMTSINVIVLLLCVYVY